MFITFIDNTLSIWALARDAILKTISLELAEWAIRPFATSNPEDSKRSCGRHQEPPPFPATLRSKDSPCPFPIWLAAWSAWIFFTPTKYYTKLHMEGSMEKWISLNA